MDNITIVTKSHRIVREAEDYLKVILPEALHQIFPEDLSPDTLRQCLPGLILLGEDLSREELRNCTDLLASDLILQHIPIVYVCSDSFLSEDYQLIKSEKLADWISLKGPGKHFLFRILRNLDDSLLRKEFNQLKMEHDYVNSKLAANTKKSARASKKANDQHFNDMINMMHYFRTYLSSIKNSFSLLSQADLLDEHKAKALDIMNNNIQKLEDYLHKNDITVKHERRDQPKPSIMKLNQLMETMLPGLHLAARKKNHSLVFEMAETNCSLLLYNGEVLEALEKVWVHFFYASAAASTIEFMTESLLSANMVRVVVKNFSSRVDREFLHYMLDQENKYIALFVGEDAKFEVFADELYTGIQVYFPRLNP